MHKIFIDTPPISQNITHMNPGCYTKVRLKSFLAASSLFLSFFSINCHASHIGGRILDSSEIYDGEIQITYVEANASNAAVQINGTSSNIQTSLTGNISIYAGKNYENSSSPTYGSGILLQSGGSNNSILLKTVNAEDAIRINAYGYAGSGVNNNNANSLITLDATSSTAGISIILSNAAKASDSGASASATEAAGIYASAGRVNAIGNINISTAQERGYGLWTGASTAEITITGNAVLGTTGIGSYGIRADAGRVSISGDLEVTTSGGPSSLIYGSYGISTAGTAEVTVDGKATIRTSGTSAHGLRANGGTITLGSADIDAKGYGVYAQSGGSIEILTGDLSVSSSSSYGIHATGSNSSITLNGIKSLTLANPSNNAIYASSGGRISGAGKYTFTGNLSAGSSSTIDLVMEEQSAFTGKTAISGTGTLNLALRDGSNWTLNANSALSKVSVDAASVTFHITGQENYFSITTGDLTMTNGAIINVILDGYEAQWGDVFELIAANTRNVEDADFDFSSATLSEGLDWDVSSFASTGIIRVVPEPSTYMIGMAGLLGGVLLIRRRFRR